MNSNFFTNNRRQLLELTRADVIVLAAYTKQQDIGDSAHRFRQEPNFFYLTGIDHADWRVIITKNRSWLVAPNVSEIHQLFDGSLSPDDALKTSGVDEVIDKKKGREILGDLSKRYTAVHSTSRPSYAGQVDFTLNQGPVKNERELRRLFSEVRDCTGEIVKLRAIKQPEEIKAIKKAASITAEGFVAAKDALAVSRHEYEVEAALIGAFRCKNASHAFEPIVARGINACTLHYISNRDKIKSSDLVLIDAGAYKDGYAADVTRTFGSTELSPRQRQVHEVIDRAEKQIIQLIQPGVLFSHYSKEADMIMKDALHSLGLLSHKTDDKKYRTYFPHATSHGLGLEVHERLGGYREFMPGMLLTVEPGVYIPEEEIGVRIEDDVLVTDSGNENLTVDIPVPL